MATAVRGICFEALPGIDRCFSAHWWPSVISATVYEKVWRRCNDVKTKKLYVTNLGLVRSVSFNLKKPSKRFKQLFSVSFRLFRWHSAITISLCQGGDAQDVLNRFLQSFLPSARAHYPLFDGVIVGA